MITSAPFPQHSVQRRNGLVLDVSKPSIMGILNVTPDSFSDGGKHNSVDAALKQCEHMLQWGVDIIDIGGESTRPNAPEVALQEEMDRVLPVLEAIRKHFDVCVSIDTSSPKLIEQAVDLGADIWNDVRSLRREGAPEMAAKLDISVMLMHMRGEPGTMQNMTDYDNVVEDVASELQLMLERALQAGIQKNNIILDVGFGFAKQTEHNYKLLNNLTRFHDFGVPLMIGLSRKRMLADALAEQNFVSDVENRIAGGLACAMLAWQQGVSIIRTHDVAQTAQALSVFTALHKYNS